MLSLGDEFGIYVHWPFCLSKCPYCDFNSHVREQIDQKSFLDAYVRELEYYAQLTNDKLVSSIFFGGGTPSLMPIETVDAIINTIQKNWRLKNDVEITLEANPTSIEREKFKGFRSAGVNRVSIGVQSLYDDELEKLGREHNAAEAIAAIDTARSVFDRYSFDLIYTREGQSLSDWERELKTALNHADGHMSLYQLTIEPGTAFHTRHQRGDLTLPDDDIAADFYNLTQDIMREAGLPAYETSNHAAAGQESRHNMVYWNYGEYAGIGAGAHGRIKIDNIRHATRAHRAPEIWRDKALSSGHGAHPFEALDKVAQGQEALMMGLRLTRGVNKADFNSKTGCKIDDVIDQSRAKALQDEGYLIQDSTTLKVTPRGMLCLNAVLNNILR